MKTIIFVCHGNICRSVAAEFIAKDYLKKHNRDNEFNVISRATSLEEIGNDIYPPMQEAMRDFMIPFDKHFAKQITKQEFENADYIFYMDNNNLYNLNRMFSDTNGKLGNITCFSTINGGISDPWYTGRYKQVLEQLLICIGDIFDHI